MRPWVLHVCGARPNFMKVAPVWRAIASRAELGQKLLHTGQHYDEKMSDVFFAELGLPVPDVALGVGSGSHAEQTAKLMVELEKVVARERPQLISVVGDVNSTLAAALVAAKACIPLAHVEAGLRSFDRGMPEEVNRVVVDRLADLLLTPSADGDANLRNEGVDPKRIVRVGNVMIDSLRAQLQTAQLRDALAKLKLKPKSYAVLTLHRPANVDDPQVLARILDGVRWVQSQLPVVFPVHPRTRATLGALADKLGGMPNLIRVDPQGYLDFLCLTSQARLVLTDSGGLQEETTALGVPCLTLRQNTERPITVSEGTNQLVGTDPKRIRAAAEEILAGKGKPGRIPEGWDGRAGERVARTYERFLGRALS
ncbi:MAG: UDP-N-acetylglucosamine 2-epimerase (non-hydrolyzing) [Deltaproteobacteria bacterium]|nr:UDP-N-acetylglucosamine 2-epimerase (non-hydrolyzing) [Deltaproteobacteria bacterium]